MDNSHEETLTKDRTMTNAEILNLQGRVKGIKEAAQPYIDLFNADALSHSYIATDSKRGLFLKERSDLYTDEERSLFKKLHKLLADAEQVRSYIDIEREQVLAAIERAELYPFTIDEAESRPLPEVLEEVEGDRATAEGLLVACQEINEKLQALGWIRYMDSFKTAKKKPDYRRALKEIKAMISSISVVNTADLLVSEAAKEAFKAVPKSLYIDIDTDYYTSRKRSIITPTDFTNSEQNVEYYTMLIEPYFFYHITAIERMNMPTGEAQGLIKEAINGFMLQLKEAIDTAPAAGETLSQSITRLPVQSYIFSQSVLSDELWRGKVKSNTKEGKQITLFEVISKSEGETEKKPVNSYIYAIHKDLKGIKGLEDFTPELEEIYNAIDSEIQAGNRYLTVDMIYKTMEGADSSKKPSAEKKAEIAQFIDNAAITRLEINNKEYAKATGRNSYGYIKANLLEVIEVGEKEIGGKPLQNVYLFKERPIVNAYADYLGQARNIPIKLLKTGTPQQHNSLRLYLLKQIDYMQHTEKRNHTIKLDTLFETLYPKLGGDRNKRKRIIGYADKMLKHWVREGHIYSYDIQGNKIIKIYLTGKEKYTAQASLNRHIALDDVKK